MKVIGFYQLPIVGHKIYPLKFKKNQTIISFISTITMKELQNIKLKSKKLEPPLPPILLRKVPFQYFHQTKMLENFLTIWVQL